MDISGLLELELFLNGIEFSSASKTCFENVGMKEVRSKIFTERRHLCDIFTGTSLCMCTYASSCIIT